MKFMKFRKSSITKIIGLVITTVTVTLPMNVQAQEPEALTKGYVKLSAYSSRLNIREGPTTKSKSLDKLKPGDIVKIIGEEKEFYKIEYYDSEGYVSKDFVAIPEKSSDDYELISAAVITAKKSSENRNYNMALACSKINGLVLKQGDQFDWYGENGVGQASKANGFKEATVIQNRRYVKGYGGGVCQVSTALYNAIYDLEIEPDEIHHHSLSSSYVPKNMDATVDYSSKKNFKFTNLKDYSIEIEAFTNKNQVIVLMYRVK